jgi:hypothetical protein
LVSCHGSNHPFEWDAHGMDQIRLNDINYLTQATDGAWKRRCSKLVANASAHTDRDYRAQHSTHEAASHLFASV